MSGYNSQSEWRWVFPAVMLLVFIVGSGSLIGSCAQHALLCRPKCLEAGYDEADASAFVEECVCTKTGKVTP